MLKEQTFNEIETQELNQLWDKVRNTLPKRPPTIQESRRILSKGIKLNLPPPLLEQIRRDLVYKYKMNDSPAMWIKPTGGLILYDPKIKDLVLWMLETFKEEPEDAKA